MSIVAAVELTILSASPLILLNSQEKRQTLNKIILHFALEI